MIRLLILCHRYLGIGVGVLMVSWCISGVVMMYVSYPALDQGTRLAHLAPIEWNGCCTHGDEPGGELADVRELDIEMRNGRPVLYLSGVAAPIRVIDLTTGAALGRVSLPQARQVAAAYVEASSNAPVLRGLIDYDQWTVAGRFNADRPLYRFSLEDAAGTELYVSSSSGQVVQMTTARERFWNWLGAVPHWLYFAQLRRNTAVWSEVLIVTSMIGCFLAVTGLYLGIRQWLRRPDGCCSPYSGLKLWHHLAGLLFGVLTLSWVLSGLLSMNPWGLLEGASAQPEAARLRGRNPSGAELLAALQALTSARPADLVSLRMAPLNGTPYFIATAVDGRRYRLDERGRAATLNAAELALASPSSAAAGTTMQLIGREDSYYFSHHGSAVTLPVYRVAAADSAGTLYYIDPVSGELLAKIDGAAKGYRWWHQGLHRLDFFPALRGRPQWDALMLLLMTGVTMVCVTGTCLGYCRLTGRSTRD
jgi:hypothetical protein